MFRSGVCKGHEGTFCWSLWRWSMVASEVAHRPSVEDLLFVASIFVESSFPPPVRSSHWLQHNPQYLMDGPTTMFNIWTDVLLTRFCVPCSLQPHPGLSGCCRLLMLNVVRVQEGFSPHDSSVKIIFVELQPNSRTGKRNSRVCQIFLEVSRVLTWSL